MKRCLEIVTYAVVAMVLSSNAVRGQVLPDGVRIGHHTLTERLTGCTVVLFDGPGATAGVDVRGSAPGTRETDLLRPGNTVERVNAIVLSGGSAFGLDAASGVVRFLEEREVGYPVGADPTVHVPIVPAAILFDLFAGGDPAVRPGPDCGYRAAAAATASPAEGNVGAGAGATVGKWNGMSGAMKSGFGVATIEFEDGLVVTAVAAVNALGDVIDPNTGAVVAGVLDQDRRFLDARALLLTNSVNPSSGENTSLAVVITNAAVTKSQATRIATMAHDGFARTIYPVHTPYDGDVIFAAGTGTLDHDVDVFRLGSVAAEAVSRAVLRAVREATGTDGLPAVRDLND